MAKQYAGFMEAIGNTPLIRLNGPSEATGCEIYGKAEFMNPGGSVKDRAARGIIELAEANKTLKPGGTIVEGTAGNTGISLAMCGNARGYKTVIVMPETQSQEKKDMLRLLGVDLRLVPAKPYKDPGNYVRYSEQLANEMRDKLDGGVIWANQFDNTDNQYGHYHYTGPEIWQQTNGVIDGFTCSVGSGGTIGGISRYLKEQNPDVTIALSDPFGSALYHHYAHGE
jgi:cysteine synthase A